MAESKNGRPMIEESLKELKDLELRVKILKDMVAEALMNNRN